jgi:hypothetical protein
MSSSGGRSSYWWAASAEGPFEPSPEDITAFVAGILEEPEEQWVREALKANPELLEYFDRALAVSERLQQLGDDQSVPPALLRRTLAAVRRQAGQGKAATLTLEGSAARPRSPFTSVWNAWVGGAIAASLLLAVLLPTFVQLRCLGGKLFSGEQFQAFVVALHRYTDPYRASHSVATWGVLPEYSGYLAAALDGSKTAGLHVLELPPATSRSLAAYTRRAGASSSIGTVDPLWHPSRQPLLQTFAASWYSSIVPPAVTPGQHTGFGSGVANKVLGPPVGRVPLGPPKSAWGGGPEDLRLALMARGSNGRTGLTAGPDLLLETDTDDSDLSPTEALSTVGGAHRPPLGMWF